MASAGATTSASRTRADRGENEHRSADPEQVQGGGLTRSATSGSSSGGSGKPEVSTSMLSLSVRLSASTDIVPPASQSSESPLSDMRITLRPAG